VASGLSTDVNFPYLRSWHGTAEVLSTYLRQLSGVKLTSTNLAYRAGFDPTVWTGRALQAESAERQ